MNFDDLVKAIRDADSALVTRATKAVNISLTMRNWLIGKYVSEYELNGADRADYGKRILAELADRLDGVSNCNQRQLNRYNRFYQTYPQIWGTVSPELNLPFVTLKNEEITSAESVFFDTRNANGIWGTASPKFHARLLESLSYSHFEKLVEIDDDTKRLFYETECLRGGWSVRELRRQIGSLYYERSGLSLDKDGLAELAQKDAERMTDRFPIRNPYVFEFLGLKPKEVMSEAHLQNQLLDRLEDFILELGHGFCFEAKSKRILIGDEHYFVDIVFYHRILKCHVLIELKIEEFSQENIGQLNTYVSWYRKNMMTEGDNPPIGILLCTGEKEALVEYALAGMDNNLFVSKYMLELPKKEEMRAFIEQQMKELDSENNEG
jgi:predicted nuclease of restriction endonuclease-like (RecB) superfamily